MPHSSNPSRGANSHQRSEFRFGVANSGSLSSYISKKALLMHALDEIGWAVIIGESQGHVLHRNLAAIALLERCDGIAIIKGNFQVLDPEDQSEFEMALTQARAGKRSMVALSAPSRMTIAVVPLRTNPSVSGNACLGKAHYTLMFSRAGVCEALMLSFYSRAHQLTASEKTILGLMCAGHSASDMVTQLKVAQATVGTHVRNISNKTRCKGIREIVKNLAVLPPLMATVMPSMFPA
jgi:DNA-binding CsgD family transcriptional regulator